MQFSVSRFYLTVLLFGVLLIGIRFAQFPEQFRFIPDNGLEYAVLRQIELERCFPLVGPLLSVENLYIPPTYFYYHYLISGQTFNPIFTGYVSALLKIFTIVFLAGAVRLVTNRRFFLLSLICLISSWLLFAVSQFVWHPNPLNLFLSFSIFLLTYAKLKHHLLSLVGAFLMYWLATSIYPSPLLLLPWYLFEAIQWFKLTPQKWWVALGKSVSLLLTTALPFYSFQLIFEIKHQWPSLRTIWLMLTQSANTQITQNSTDLTELYHFMMGQILHVRDDWPGYGLTTGFIVLSTLILAIASIYRKSHHWRFYFPYLPFGLLIAQVVLISTILPGQLHQHWFSLFLIVLIPSIFEAAFKLWQNIQLRLLCIALCAVLFVHNASFYWESLTTAQYISEQFIAKNQRMEVLNQFFIDRDIRPNSTLVLDRSPETTTYTDTYLLQYAAMENWTLLHYQTLLPPMSPACNEYIFFEAPEIKKTAKNIFLLESSQFATPPEHIFDVFEKKFSFDLDDEKRATWYVSTVK